MPRTDPAAAAKKVTVPADFTGALKKNRKTVQMAEGKPHNWTYM